MAIPKVKEQDILNALKYIDEHGVPDKNKPEPKLADTTYVTGQYGIKPPLVKVPERQNPYGTGPKYEEKKEEFIMPEISEGDAVKHKSFGDGTVTKLDKAGKHIRVKFATGEKTFIFPDAFKQGFLKL